MLVLVPTSVSVTVQFSPSRTAASGMRMRSSVHGTVLGVDGVPAIVAEPPGASPLTVSATENAVVLVTVMTDPVPLPPNAERRAAATVSKRVAGRLVRDAADRQRPDGRRLHSSRRASPSPT